MMIRHYGLFSSVFGREAVEYRFNRNHLGAWQLFIALASRSRQCGLICCISTLLLSGVVNGERIATQRRCHGEPKPVLKILHKRGPRKTAIPSLMHKREKFLYAYQLLNLNPIV